MQVCRDRNIAQMCHACVALRMSTLSVTMMTNEARFPPLPHSSVTSRYRPSIYVRPHARLAHTRLRCVDSMLDRACLSFPGSVRMMHRMMHHTIRYAALAGGDSPPSSSLTWHKPPTHRQAEAAGAAEEVERPANTLVDVATRGCEPGERAAGHDHGRGHHWYVGSCTLALSCVGGLCDMQPRMHRRPFTRPPWFSHSA